MTLALGQSAGGKSCCLVVDTLLVTLRSSVFQTFPSRQDLDDLMQFLMHFHSDAGLIHSSTELLPANSLFTSVRMMAYRLMTGSLCMYSTTDVYSTVYPLEAMAIHYDFAVAVFSVAKYGEVTYIIYHGS